ncbi:MAG TPA: M23 family metallopeptidase [Pyrinomonadaceae bacterium]|nr:M23 family metallopeptidase [Pyrinomonadaceae bacterium]
MAAPKINVEVQPTQNGKAYYLPIAPKSAGDPERVKIVLRLRITNNETKPITLNDITFAFPDIPIAMKGEKLAMDPAGDADPNDGVIAPGTTAVWSNGVVDFDTSEAGENKVRNEVYLKAPAPAKVKINLTFAKFSDPFTMTMDLIPFTNPTGDGSFLLPFSVADLDHGEYVVTSAQHWANGGANGTQIYAHDIDLQARVSGQWTALLSGKDGTKNNHYRIWGKPVRALADGTIISFANDFDDNPVPGEKLSADANHVWVRHGDVKVYYTHFQKGSIPIELRQVNAPVTAGQILGLAGNSGRSSNPHLHLECRDFATNSLRGLPFKRGWVLERELIASDGTGPWVRLTSDGISKEKVAIWPALFLPLPPPDLDEVNERIVGQVFGGVSKDGGGFVIVNGKIIRVPPRGPKWALLESLIAVNAVEQLRHPQAERMKRDVTETIRDIAKDLGREF